MKDKVTRRSFLKSAAIAAGLAASVPVLEACAQVAPTPVIIEKRVVETVIVEKPVEVEKKVVQTVIVEKPVEKKVVETVIVEKPVVTEKLVTQVVEKKVEVTPTPQYKDVFIEVAIAIIPNNPEHYIEQLVAERFERETPGVKVKLRITSDEAWAEKLKLIMKTGENPPEVVTQMAGGPGFSATETMKTRMAEGWIHDLTEAMAQPSYDTPGKTWKETFTPAALQTMMWEGRIIAAPRRLSAIFVMYNKVVLDKFGIDPAKILMWEDLIAACETIKKGGIDPIAGVSGAALVYMTHWYTQILHRLIGSDGVRNLIVGVKPVAEEPAVLEAAKMFQQLVSYAQPGWEGTEYMGRWALFTTNKAAFNLDGIWMVPTAKTMPEGFDMGVMFFPAIKGGKGTRKMTMAWPILMNVSAKSKHPELGVRYLWVQTSVEFQKKYAHETNFITGVQGVPPPDFPPAASAFNLLQEAEEIGLFFDVYAEYVELWTKFFEIIGKLALGTLDPEGFVKEMDTEFKKYWTGRERTDAFQ